MRTLLQSLFHIVHYIKPSSSREESPEMYLLALQYYGDDGNRTIKGNEKANSRVEMNQIEIERLLSEARRVRTKKKEKE